MKILIINPNSDIHTAKILQNKANMVLPEEADMEVQCLKTTPLLISSYKDCAMAAAELVTLS